MELGVGLQVSEARSALDPRNSKSALRLDSKSYLWQNKTFLEYANIWA